MELLAISNISTIISEVPVLVNETGLPGKYTGHALVVTFILLLTLVKFGRRKSPSQLQWAQVLKQIPVPSGLPLIGNLHQIVTTSDIIKTLGELARAYPRYYRLQVGSVPVVILTSPEAVEKLLSSNDDGHMGKADEYSVLADYWDEGLATSCGDKWRARRKLFSPLFNYKCFPHFLEVFNRHSKHLMHDLDSLFQESEPKAKPIQIPIYESALKIICETSMGVTLNDTSEEFDRFFEEADRTKEFIFRRISRPWYRVNWIWKFHPFRPVYEQNVKYIKDYIFKVIREARQKFIEENEKENGNFIINRNRNKTVMDVMLENGMSDSDIREEAHTVMSAGHETSASAIQFALMLLAQYPEHQIRCQEEIDRIITDEERCPNGDFNLISLADLKYTERCVKETLRMYPIAYLTGRKIRIPLKIDENLVLPEDTTCMVVATDLHMNPDIYPEPEKFDPSRFTPENSSVRHPYAYIPFSAGPRICLGYKFAMAEMKLILARILHHFSVSTTDKIENVPLDASIALTPSRGYNFLLRNRYPLPVRN